ncbi:MAG TPA: DinB family protein [Deinococcales bacterium]|nr:DinB family protein [Deinococcales bacterium]
MSQPAIAGIRASIHEAFFGPEGEWGSFIEHGSGVLDTLARVSAAQAQAEPAPGRTRLVTMTSHLAESLEYAIKAIHGQPVDWNHHEDPVTCTPAEWTALQARLRDAALAMNDRLADEKGVDVTTIVGTLAHTAYHVGGMRQIALMHLAQG